MKILPNTWTSKTKLTQKMRDAFYKTSLWEKCRGTVLDRDGYLCQVCMQQDEPTPANTVHHIIHLKDDPSKALDEDNLISVCYECHNDLHPEKGFGQSKSKTKSKRIKTFEVNSNPESFW